MRTRRRGAGAPGPQVLSEDILAADPVSQFSRWLADADAAGLPQPNAMVLATTSEAGRSHARTVLLKEHSARGFVFYTNHTSRKGRDLAANPWACAVFPWHAVGRQVTVEGGVSRMTQEESRPYFQSRPRGSRIGAWASRQSRVVGSRADLDDRYAELERRWPPGTEVPMPDFWGGYLLVPETVEFWLSRENRLHDRLRYVRAAGGWTVERLAP
jgi:pyridoxamine 5'-phosphate oxidase